MPRPPWFTRWFCGGLFLRFLLEGIFERGQNDRRGLLHDFQRFGQK